ncbi:hypothetical protein Hanom_Chr15g01351481 [Helianthus anomalus]
MIQKVGPAPSRTIALPYIISVLTDIIVISGVNVDFSFINCLYKVGDLPVKNTKIVI